MKKTLWILLLVFGFTNDSFSQIGWWTSSDTLNVFNKNKGSILIGSYQSLGKLTVGPDDKFYNLSLVGDYNNLAKNYLQIGVTGRGFENLQGQTIFDLYHSNTQFKNAGYNFRINGQSQFFINGEGNIGIGTEKPEAKLDLSGGPNWGGFTKAMRIPGEHAIKFESAGSEYGMVATGGMLNFVTSNQNESTNPFGVPFSRIMSLQRNKVVIEGDIEVKGKIYSQGQIGSGGDLPIDNGGGSGGGGPVDDGKGGGGILPTIAPQGSSAQDWVISSSNANDIYYNYGNGKVGIGINNPTQKLDVRGGSYFEVAMPAASSYSAPVYTKNTTAVGGTTGNYSGNLIAWMGTGGNNVGIHSYLIRTNNTTNWWDLKIRLSASVDGGGYAQDHVYNNQSWIDFGMNSAPIQFGIGTNTPTVTIFNNRVGIGIINPDANYLLSVNGKIKAQELYLTTTVWPDFVFEQGHSLRTLRQVENYIKKNGRLPDIPSQKEVEENGVGVIDMQSKLLQKIEELTLYVIEQNKEIEKLKKRLNREQ